MNLYDAVLKKLENVTGERLKAIGAECGLSPRTMYYIKQGKGNPGVRHVQNIYDWFRKHRG